MTHSRIVKAVVATALVGSLAACGSTTHTASGTPAPVTSAAASPSASASPSSSTSAPASLTPDQLEAIRTTVGAVYFQGVTDVEGSQTKPDTAELAADFVSPDARNQVWGTGSDRPLSCGTAKYNGVAIGLPQQAGDAVDVPVRLFLGTQAGTTAITVAVDPSSGKVKSVACGGQPDASAFPGLAPIVGYYGAMASGDGKVLNARPVPFFTAAFEAWTPASSDYDTYSCAQYVPDRWVVALTGTSESSSAWDFADDALRTQADPQNPESPTGFRNTLAVDLSAAKVSRVTCDWAKAPKIPDPAVAANRAPAAVGSYATQLLDFYSLAADQTGFGVDAKGLIRPFFVSDSAFATAWSQSGPVPLLCAQKVPGDVEVSGSAAVSGDTATLNMVAWPEWHPDNPGQEAGKFTLTLDLTTMKISGLTCTK